jgi:hypothetical protein
MPPKPFKKKDELISLFLEIAEGPGAATQHASCVVSKCHVRNVPLKPSADQMDDPKHKAALSERCNRLVEMYPVGLIKENIGSNLGLMRIMRSHFEEKNQHLAACHNYTAFNVDTNIFDRMLKV